MASSLRCVSILLLVAVSLCDKATAEQNAYNFMCDRSPQQHDRILRDAIMNLERGDKIMQYAISIMIF